MGQRRKVGSQVFGTIKPQGGDISNNLELRVILEQCLQEIQILEASEQMCYLNADSI